MIFSADLIEELHLLSLFDVESTQQGLKLHEHSAAPAAIAAAKRLYEKGLITQDDGGYLTPLGWEAAEHAQALLTILTSRAELSTS